MKNFVNEIRKLIVAEEDTPMEKRLEENRAVFLNLSSKGAISEDSEELEAAPMKRYLEEKELSGSQVNILFEDSLDELLTKSKNKNIVRSAAYHSSGSISGSLPSDALDAEIQNHPSSTSIRNVSSSQLLQNLGRNTQSSNK